MRHLKPINEGLTYAEFTDILMNTPVYYPVFYLMFFHII